jgi:hypothetical protein
MNDSNANKIIKLLTRICLALEKQAGIAPPEKPKDTPTPEEIALQLRHRDGGRDRTGSLETAEAEAAAVARRGSHKRAAHPLRASAGRARRHPVALSVGSPAWPVNQPAR